MAALEPSSYAWSAMILVTGGTGFIGRALVRLLLADGRRVRIPTRHPERTAFEPAEDVQLVCCDLADADDCRRAMEGCTQVYHLAGWISTRRADRDAVVRANVDTTRNLLRAIAEQQPERVVYLASIFALGGGTEQPANEEVDYNLERSQIPYLRAKRQAELLVVDAVRQGAPIVSVYPTYCLGPGDDDESSAGVLLEYLRRPMGMYVRGGVNVVHVSDAARGLVLAMQRGVVGRQYLVGGDNQTWRELHRRAARVAGVPIPRLPIPSRMLRTVGALSERLGTPPIDRGSAEIATQYWYYDDRRARQELGYQSRPLEETLRESIQWYRQVGKLSARGRR